MANQRKKFIESTLAFYILVSVVILLVLGWGIFVLFFWQDKDMATKGQFGDTFGFITALFTAISFLFFLRALKLQRDQLEGQRRDLEVNVEAINLQREEIRQSNIIFEAQKNAIQIQQAEATFFKLIENHANLIRTIEIDTFIGYVSVNKVRDKFINSLGIYEKAMQSKEFDDISDTLLHPACIYYEKEELRVIIDSITHIVSWIEKKLPEEKEFYHQTLFNILNPSERFILGMAIYNGFIKDFPKMDAFNYTTEYLSKSPYNIGNGYFTPLEFRVEEFKVQFFNVMNEIEPHRSKLNFLLKFHPLYEGDNLNYNGFTLECVETESGRSLRKETRTMKINLKEGDWHQVNIFESLKNTAITSQDMYYSSANNTTFDMKVKHLFEFNRQLFVVNDAWRFSFGKTSQGTTIANFYRPN